MNLTYKDNLFHLTCDYTKNSLIRNLGFNWCRKRKCWVTPFTNVAIKLFLDRKEKTNLLPSQYDGYINNIDTELLKKLYPQYDREIKKGLQLIEKGLYKETITIEASHAVKVESGNFLSPLKQKINNSYYPYQLAGIQFMLKHKNILLADQMGLGKTIQVLGLINNITPKPEKTLIVCPASLKYNWLREFEKWNTTNLTASFIENINTDWLIRGVTIINYDKLKKYEKQIKEIEWDLLILDEAHYLKNPKAQRTRIVCGYKGLPAIEAKKKIALTGTPIVNRPIELFSALNYLYPKGWANRFFYAKRYCNAYKGKWGWDMSGASNLEELQYNLRSTIMIRRLKKDVLKDLPDKVRQIIELEGDTQTKQLVKIEQAIWKETPFFRKNIDVFNKIMRDEDFKEFIQFLKNPTNLLFEQLSTLRKDLAIAKVPIVINHLQDAIENSGKVVCFCHHKEVAKEVKKAFSKNSVMLIGETPLNKRDQAVKAFQTDPNINLFIGNIQAAGTGITLTASSHVIFIELSWVPGEMNQAEDRLHRIGQKNSVLVQYLVLRESLDVLMAKKLIKKQEIIDKALDKET